MKSIKNNKLVVFFVAIFVVNSFAMRMTAMGKKSAEKGELAQAHQLQKERESQYQPGKYFIYEKGTSKGILVDVAMVKENCKSIEAMVEDMGMEPDEIPLDYPVDTLKLAFDALNGDVDVNNLSAKELVDIASVFNFLDVSVDKMNTVLAIIKDKTIDRDKNVVTNTLLKALNPDLQKLLLTDASVSCLKYGLIKKYAKDRRKELGALLQIGLMTYIVHPYGVDVVAFSPDGTKIIAGTDVSNKYNLSLWDAKTCKIITFLITPGAQAIAFNPDGKSFVSGGSQNQNSLILCNISDITNITQQLLPGYNAALNVLAFNPDGKSFVAGYYRTPRTQPNLSLYDISDVNNIIFKPLIGHPKAVMSVVFSPDGKYVLSSCLDFKDNLILRDITDRDNIISYNLADKLPPEQEHSFRFVRVAFHPDGKRFVTYGHEVLLWDISNLNNIAFKVLVDNIAQINIGTSAGKRDDNSLAISHDGTTIALGHDNGFTLLNINDPTVFVSVDQFDVVKSLAFSPDDKQIVTGGTGGGENQFRVGKYLNLWTLVTDQEDVLLKQIKNYNADQIRLMYQLCSQFLKDQKVTLEKDSEEEKIFMTLPQDMQKLLNDLFFS